MVCHRYWQAILLYAVAIKVAATSQPSTDTRESSWMKCPDHSSMCHTGRNNTCCYNKNTPSVYGCCEGHNAVCCNDMRHCCPENHRCDLQKGICSQTISTAGQLMRTESIAIDSPDNVPCIDHSQCPNKNTCCRLPTGGYGCCPYAEATCCEDKIHCCPHSFKCDPSSNKCIRTEALLLMLPSHIIICPDYKTTCFSNETCCKLTNKTSNSWACCPATDAVCCDDYCCPKGKVCDISQGDCRAKPNTHSKKIQYTNAIQHTKVHSYMKEDNKDIVNSFPCKTKCNVDQTCCGLGLNDRGCCPEKEAKCCSDGQHCCPDSYICLPNGKCIKTEY